jgi:hypothetical protein
MPFFVSYENALMVIFDQWPKLYLGFDVEPEIRILKVIYHLGTVSPLSMFFINQPLVLQKNKPLYPNSKYLFWNEI